MKAKFLVMSLLMLATINLAAQNSSLEEKLNQTGNDSTMIEKFINKCNFYSIEIFYKSDDKTIEKCKGLYMEGFIYKDLLTNQKVGGIQLWDDAKKEINFGWLDFDEIDDLIAALSKMLEEFSIKHYGKSYAAYYETRGGIDVTFEIKGLNNNSRWCETWFHKKWYYSNIYGTRIKYTVSSKGSRSEKRIASIIQVLTEVKEILAKELIQPE